MTRTFAYDDEEGQTGGRDVYISDNESSVLGPDGEPLRVSSRQRIGFDLTPRPKAQKQARTRRHW